MAIEVRKEIRGIVDNLKRHFDKWSFNTEGMVVCPTIYATRKVMDTNLEVCFRVNTYQTKPNGKPNYTFGILNPNPMFSDEFENEILAPDLEWLVGVYYEKQRQRQEAVSAHLLEIVNFLKEEV